MPLAAMIFLPGFALFGLAGLALTVWALVDVVSRPDWAFQSAGSSKVLWVVLEIVGLLICGGIVFSLIYLLAIRPKVSAAAAFGEPGPSGSGWAPPPPGWGSPPSGWTPPPPGWNPPPPPGWNPPPSGWAPAPPAPSGPAPQPPPGWYADPSGSGGTRYWDGAKWSD